MSRRKKNWLLIAAGIGLAMDAIRGHKMRSFLTVLGVIIGTGTIIGVGSILTGFDGAVTSAIKGFGADSIIVFKWQAGISFGRRPAEERRRKPLTYENAVAIRERCPSVQVVSPYLFPAQGFHRARYKGNESLQLDFGGTDPAYAEGGQADMMSGRFFTEFENLHRSPVVVIGEDLNKSLFAGTDSIGKELDVDGHAFQIVGVMHRPANSFPGQHAGSLQGIIMHHPVGKNAQVPPWPAYTGRANRDRKFFFRNFSLDQPVALLGLKEKHRIGVAHRRFEQSFGIVGVGWDDHLQAGYMGKKGFQAL